MSKRSISRALSCRVLVTVAVSLLSSGMEAFGNTGSGAGGDTTVDDASNLAFSRPLANLSNAQANLQHDVGEQGFHRDFSRSRVGGKVVIGPKFNNVSCVACHPGNGRSTPTLGGSRSQSVVKVSAQNTNMTSLKGPAPVQGIGLQIRDHAIRGATSDGRLRILWEVSTGTYSDGTPFQLRKPLVLWSRPSSKIPNGTMFSLRRPPPVFGAGLLEAVSVESLVALSDAEDLDHDGISGRPNFVLNVTNGRRSVGKFGFKASAPTVLQQVAGAYSTDMGVSNPLFPAGDRTPDITRRLLERTVFYTQTLAVPLARAQDDFVVRQGREIFGAIGCNRCHIESLTTGHHSIQELSRQNIQPFTDLLLHDMGAGLADHRPDFSASGSEWRTTPLWGIGLTEVVLGPREVSYLHDGRARTLQEAILWHGGEGENAKRAFIELAASERDSLIKFLRSL